MPKNADKATENSEKKHEREKFYLYAITRIYVLIILAIFPLCVGFEGYDDIVHSKALIFWNTAIVFLIVFGLFYLVYRFGLDKTEQPPRFWKTFSIPDWAALAFVVIITISCLLSPYKDIVFLGQINRNDGWLTYFCMVMSYFVLSRWYKPNQLDFAAFSISSMLVCIIAYLQLYGMDFLNLFPYNSPYYVDANGNPIFTGFSIIFRSTIGNIDFVGGYVCMTVLVFGALYVNAKGFLRFLFLAASVMNFAFAIIGDSDAGKVGILGAVILLIPYWVFKRERLCRALVLFSLWGFVYAFHHWFVLNRIIPNWPEGVPPGGRAWDASVNSLPLNLIVAISIFALVFGILLSMLKGFTWPKEKTAAFLGGCLIALIVVGGLSVVEITGNSFPESNMIYQAREIMHGRMHDSFGSHRAFTWRKAIEIFPQQPFFGTGSDTFIHAFGTLNQEESLSMIGVVFDKAHNDFLQILLCNGILALASYLALIVGIVVLSIKKTFGDDILFVALGGVFAYLIQSFFGIDTITVTPIYWILLAIVRQRQVATAQ